MLAVSNAFKVADGDGAARASNIGVLGLRMKLDARRGLQDFPYAADVLPLRRDHQQSRRGRRRGCHGRRQARRHDRPRHREPRAPTRGSTTPCRSICWRSSSAAKKPPPMVAATSSSESRPGHSPVRAGRPQGAGLHRPRDPRRPGGPRGAENGRSRRHHRRPGRPRRQRLPAACRCRCPSAQEVVVEVKRKNELLSVRSDAGGGEVGIGSRWRAKDSASQCNGVPGT